ncbi:MAG TPA: sensor histidine kinase [Gemmatimonadaceae bacterium]|nr:sensor histidine kinase [Gemmatimonadaceae bacterium]
MHVRLQEFIRDNSEPILAEWVAFARKRTGADGTNLIALRDHAADMLRQIADDLATPQTPREQFDKSQGTVEESHGDEQSDAHPECDDSAAEAHGSGRANSGFTVGEMVAEFRALRASVLRLWIGQRVTLAQTDLDDMMRFNEAIDQAVAESVSRFTRDMDSSRDMFIGVLSHDLRTPLQSVLMTTEHLLHSTRIEAHEVEALGRAHRSAQRMQRMIDELLDFTRSRLGGGISITTGDIDVAAVARESVEEVSATCPDHSFDVQVDAALPGQYDGDRLRQVFVNLLANAAEHGLAGTPISLTASGSDSEIVVAVRNAGPVIAPEAMAGLFGPYKRLRQGAGTPRNSRHLGLGLYIAEQIVTAHGGQIDVTSTDADGTCFTTRLPR